jgi:hypothetical protein
MRAVYEHERDAGTDDTGVWGIVWLGLDEGTDAGM